MITPTTARVTTSSSVIFVGVALKEIGTVSHLSAGSLPSLGTAEALNRPESCPNDDARAKPQPCLSKTRPGSARNTSRLFSEADGNHRHDVVHPSLDVSAHIGRNELLGERRHVVVD